MYRSSFQRGLLTVLFGGGSNPLGIWEITKSKDGYIKRFLDQDIKAMVIEVRGNNVSTTYLTCPPGQKVLGIVMPFLVMIVKSLNKYFVFEITILDETDTRRRFRIANFQSTTQITPLCTVMPLCLSDGWNQIQFNLAEFTRRAYNKQFVEVQKIRINANIRIRRIYCAERLIPEEELPPEYKLYFPLPSIKKGKGKENNQQQSSVGEKIESKLDVKVVKSNDGSGMQVNPAAALAPPEGVDAKGAPATPADAEVERTEGAPAEGIRAERKAGESVLDKETAVVTTLVEGEPGEKFPADETEEGKTALADEMPASEATEVEILLESVAMEVEELAGEVLSAVEGADPSEPAPPEPTESTEPEVTDEVTAIAE